MTNVLNLHLAHPLRVGIGGPVGSGKTALVEALCMTKRYLLGFGLVALCMVYASLPLIKTRPVEAQTPQSSLNIRPVEPQTPQTSAVFDSQGRMKVPTGFRKWVFVGAP